MPTTSEDAERRLTHRVNVCGNAVLHFGRAAVMCRIADLSNGGIGLRCIEIRGLDAARVGEVVEVDLRLEPRSEPGPSHRGVIRHVDVSAGRVGISFTDAPSQWQESGARRAAGVADVVAPLRLVIAPPTEQRSRVARFAEYLRDRK